MCEIYKESEPGEFRSWQLCDPNSDAEEPIKMIVGAEIFVARRNCVAFNLIVQAAQAYYQQGIADEAFEWEQS